MRRLFARLGALAARARAGWRWVGWKRVGIVAVLLVALAIPWWAPPLLSQLEFFRVRKVEITGVRYLAADEVFARLALDSAASVWDDTDPLRARILEHPQVVDVRIARRLPGTLVVRVAENLPIALVASAEGMRPVDAQGRELPFDPSKVSVDLPLIPAADSSVAAFLAGVRDRHPGLFDRISDVRIAGEGEVLLFLGDFVVRAAPDLSPARLADIIPVQEDLARRGARVVELDLRFRDQVIARVQ